MKRKIFFSAIVIAIAGLLIANAAGIPTKNAKKSSNVEKNFVPMKLNTTPLKLERQELTLPMQDLELQTQSNSGLKSPPGDIWTVAAQHPAFGDSGTGGLVAAYEYHNKTSGEDLVLWSGSCDDGNTWPVGVYWLKSTNPDVPMDATYPSVDYWGYLDETNPTQFYGTMVPPADWNNGGPFFLVEIGDPCNNETYSGSYWNWANNGWFDMKMAEIAACNIYADTAPWAWGFGSMVHSTTYTTPTYIDGPFITWQFNETGWATISWYTNLSGCETTSCDIDRVTSKTYAVWDWFNNEDFQYQLVIRKDDYQAMIADEDYDPELVIWYFDDPDLSIRNPVVAVHNDNIVILTEIVNVSNPGDRDIVCWHTNDGNISNLDISIVAGSVYDEAYPEISHITGNWFVTDYVNASGDALMRSTTQNCGGKWKWYFQVTNSTTDDVVEEYRTCDIAEHGIKLIWEYFNLLDTPPRDINLHWASISTLPGDFDFTCTVDFTDFTVFSGAYGSQQGDPNYNTLCDLNCDTVVDFTDFTIFSGWYGKHCEDLWYEN